MRVEYTYTKNDSGELCIAYATNNPRIYSEVTGEVRYTGNGSSIVSLSERVPGEGGTEWSVKMGLISAEVPAQSASAERV